LKFAKEFVKLSEKAKKMGEQDTIKLLKAINANNLNQTKKYLKDEIFPISMLPTISGYHDQEGVRTEIDMCGATVQEFIETDKINPIEFACARGCSEIVKFLVNEIGFKRKENFNIDSKTLKIEQMPFI
jgi:hypothetical protein